MAVTRMELTVWYEDGSKQEVSADQRDIVIFEREMKYGFVKAMDDMPITAFRHIAYSAIRRTNGGTPPLNLDRKAWEAIVVEVEPDAEDNSADPGQPEAQEDNSSS